MVASTSYNQIPSSSTSPPTSWDVFLSFRGSDTRNTFTGHLYKDLCRNGIKAFKDDPELLSGEVISRALPQAIQESKTFIVVLSENYASSSWCLDELVEILRCYKRNQRLVIPVFYYIDPSVVRHQIKSFEKAFEKHQARLDLERVKTWRLTLNEVAGFSGYHISQNRSEADIIDEVVSRILLEINPKTLHVATYLVGLDSRIEGIKALFNSNLEGVNRIGIHGMGGVGKTTLAKAVYNLHYHRFQGSCFLANVREVSRTTKGLVCLQQQLISDVLKCNNINISNVDQGIELIRARICSKKVLVVIDDLDDPKPLEYLEGSFALGSMVIITTRNEDLLDTIEVKAKYKVNKMDKDESRQLFNQHAFGDGKISNTFTELSKVILERAGGLPLALQVFGSNLLNQSEEGWRWFIDKLNRVPIDDVKKNLMISFDALKSVDPILQDIFLDIACFYIGWKKEEVVKILETCYTFVNLKVDILQKRSLITISDEDKLGMHDLLRDMGRKIARNNSPDEPGKHSRLWVSEEIDTVLKNHKGTEAIQGIISGYHYYKMNGVTYVAESFRRMRKLKFLYLNNVNLTGSFEQTFKDLRWLCWDFFPLECFPSDFYAEKLVILELPWSNMRITWEPPREFKKLKTLNMMRSQKLETTPDFTRFPCLETLNLVGCSTLQEVHVSIGSLVSLVHLNLGGCSALRSLPGSICRLRALEVLIVDSCTRLEALPTELGSIESLKTLNARRLTVSKLPVSIGHLSNLVELDLNNNVNLETLPDSICNLRLLEILDISDCEKLEELPDQLGMITSLRELNLKKDAMLRMLPDISQLSNIKDLDLTGCYHMLSISELPTNLERIKANGVETLDLSSLKHLKELDLGSCSYLTEIQGLEELTSLEDLNLRRCSSMKRLPNLSNLKHLKRLDLKYCDSLTEVIGLEELTSLKDFKFSYCGNLLSFSGFPPNQKRVKAKGCTSLKRLPDLSSSKQLERVDLANCWSLKRLPDLSSLKHLKRLDLENCEALKEIQVLEEVSSLKYLNLSNCRSMERLPNLCNLKHLKRLYLSFCYSLTEIIGLEEVISLNELEFRYCGNLLSVSELPPNLYLVDAVGCTSLKRLPNLSNLKRLERLDLENCEALKEIQGLEEVTSLEYLTLWNCRSLERLPNLCNLKHLKWLYLYSCEALKEIQGLEEVTSLEYLNLSNCRSMERLPNLCNLKHLKGLYLYSCEALKEIQGLEEVTSLEYLNLSKCRCMERLPNLSNLKHLRRLDLRNCVSLTEVIGLEEVTSLKDFKFCNCGNLLSVSGFPPNQEWINAQDCTSLKRLPDLSSLKHLKRLNLENCEALKEIQGLEEVTSLGDLNISNCRSMERLPNLSNLKHLRRLNLRNCASLTEVIGLEEVTSLEDFKFSYCGNLLSVSGFPPNQEWINAQDCTSLKRLPDLSNLNHLRRLDLRNCDSLTEFIGLEELTCLRELHLAGCNSSFLARTLTKRFFEILSGFGHKTEISVGPKGFRDWIRTLPSEFGFVRYCLDHLGIQLELRPNASHNFLAIILAFEETDYIGDNKSLIVIVPNSILSIRDGDKIELESNGELICGIHLLYKTEKRDT